MVETMGYIGATITSNNYEQHYIQTFSNITHGFNRGKIIEKKQNNDCNRKNRINGTCREF